MLIDPYLVQADPDDLPASHLQLQARAWEIVSTLVTQEPAIYQPRRGGMVLRHAQLHGVSYPSVYRYLRRYWERGQNANALLPDYKNSGGRGKTRSVNPAVKRGRPRKGEGHPGMNACDDVRRNFPRRRCPLRGRASPLLAPRCLPSNDRGFFQHAGTRCHADIWAIQLLDRERRLPCPASCCGTPNGASRSEHVQGEMRA
ncbi:hypothetical protein LP420_33510 [Massilia sp. B-10]|nr:hypothetical protein LP420_33510 [Massilia sp. B-10]